MNKTGLRWDLRSATASAHSALDAKVSELDIATYEGLTVFLAGNAIAHRVLSTFDDVFEGLMSHRLELLHADLEALGEPVPETTVPYVPPTFETAPGFRYVMAGSAMGGRLLARRHAASDDTSVLQAGRFLTDQSLETFWRDVQSELASLPRSEATRNSVEAGAVACFNLFNAAFNAVLGPNQAGEARH